MKSSKKVLLFTTDLYRGGIAKASARYAMTLAENMEVWLVVYDNVPVSIELPENIKVKRINLPLSANWGKTKYQIFKRSVLRIIGFPIAYFKFLFYIYQIKPDVIFSLGYIPNIFAVFSKLFYKVTVYISERTYTKTDLEHTGLKGKLVILLSKLCYKHSNYVIAITKELALYLLEEYKIHHQKIIVIPNYFDFDHILKQKNEQINPSHLKILNSNRNIITSGRLSRQKGVWFLIRAFKQLSKLHKDVNLIILGDGELKSYYEKIIVENDLQDRIFLFGNVNNPMMYFRFSEIFVFPSIWEGFPNALLEAMVCGLPVISANCPTGPKEILVDNGYPEKLLIERLPNIFLEKENLLRQEIKMIEAMTLLLNNNKICEDLSIKVFEIAKLYSKEEIEKQITATFNV